MLNISHISKTFNPGTTDAKKALNDLSLDVNKGDFITVIGANGAGKSTLVKGLCGELPLMAGKLWRGQGLSIGYFAQHQLDALRLDETPLEHLRRLSPDTREQDLRDFLGGFRFSGDQVNEQAGSMSGGEKARLALALIAWKKPNLLVLDEPTNHLDMETREALTMALSTFGGSVLIVSHDRHLLRAATERLWLVHEGRVTEFEGDLDDYAELVLASRRDEKSAARAAKAASSDAQQTPREARKAAARERARIAELKKPFRKRLSEIESRVAELEESLSELDSRIADPAFYQGSPEEVQAVLKQRAAEGEEKDSLEEEWLEVSEKLEQAGS